jgi:membrane protease YdiL (CAAX protease family)
MYFYEYLRQGRKSSRRGYNNGSHTSKPVWGMQPWGRQYHLSIEDRSEKRSINMQVIKEIFWNSKERRIRALWRLLSQLVLAGLAILPLQIIVGFVAIGVLISQQGVTPGELTDPALIEQAILQHPGLNLLSSLSTLIAIVLSVWIAGRFLDKRPFSGFGFHINSNWWLDFAFGLLLGLFLMALIFLVELSLGWVSVSDVLAAGQSPATYWLGILASLALFLSTGFYEELFARGYQLTNIAEGLAGSLGKRGAILAASILSSIVFGYLHITNPNADWLSLFNIFLAGTFLLGMGYLLTGELAIPIGVHIAWNFFQGNVFGFPVSGLNLQPFAFLHIQQSGPELWTGGAFGPEGGLIGVAAILLGAVLISLYVFWRYGRIDLHIPIAEPPQPLQVRTPQQRV